MVGVRPESLYLLSMGTGEPETSQVVCPVLEGTGRKGSHDLAGGLPDCAPLPAAVRPSDGIGGACEASSSLRVGKANLVRAVPEGTPREESRLWFLHFGLRRASTHHFPPTEKQKTASCFSYA